MLELTKKPDLRWHTVFFSADECTIDDPDRTTVEHRYRDVCGVPLPPAVARYDGGDVIYTELENGWWKVSYCNRTAELWAPICP